MFPLNNTSFEYCKILSWVSQIADISDKSIIVISCKDCEVTYLK